MENLVFLKKNDVFTNSLVIAEGTGNKHKNVKELIIKYKNDLEDFGKVSVLNVALETNGGIQIISYYQLNEEQSTFLVTLLRNSKIVVAFKKELVKQFYQMRQLLLEKQTQQWIETRYQGKLTRKSETDMIQQLVEYAQTQGSKHADKLYVVYSKLANKIAGIHTRDTASTLQLNNLLTIENIILHLIEDGIKASKDYKQIYNDCKERLIVFQSIAYLAC